MSAKIENVTPDQEQYIFLPLVKYSQIPCLIIALNVDELNAIYKQVIGICKIAPRLLPDVPTASEDFSFNKILSRLH